MFCPKCGTRLGEDARFCSECGASILQQTSHTEHSNNAAVENASMEVQPPGGGTAQVPYGGYVPPQPPYGGYVPPEPPYGGYVPPGGYPPYGAKPAKKPMSKKAKALIWGGIGLAVVLAIAAVLVFVVFAGGGGPLSGNTVQTQFVNEAVKVFAGAFSDFSALKMTDITEQPFDMELLVTVKGGGLGTAAKVGVEMAYDQQDLGAAVDAGFVRIKLLMQEDTLYVDNGYSVMGVQLDSDADLSKPMSLKQRLAALAGGENEADIKRLVEAFVNSISEECFIKTGRSFTLELSEADMRDALEMFEVKLNQDRNLRNDMESLLQGEDIDDILAEAISSLRGAKFDLTIEIEYKGGAPAGLNVDIESYGATMEMAFEYEKKNNVTLITLDAAGAGMGKAEIELELTNVPGGLELIGSMEAGYDSLDLDGLIEKSGNTLFGSLDISDGREEGTLEFEYTVIPGMPRKAVQEDRRFAIDTDDAQILDIEDVMFSSMLGMMNWY